MDVERAIQYADQTIPIVDPRTGNITKAQFFVADPGRYSYTYVEATEDQKLRIWIGPHRRAFDFFGAVP